MAQLALLAARVPIVLIAAYPDELHADVIGADNRSGTKAAVCHLVEQHGRTRLFYIAGPAKPRTRGNGAARSKKR